MKVSSIKTISDSTQLGLKVWLIGFYRSLSTLSFRGATSSLLMLLGAWSASANETVTANVTGFSSDKGNAVFVVYANKKGFASDLEPAVIVQTHQITGDSVSVSFDGLDNQDYALFVFHDEDANGEFKTNWIGFPKEGAGNSNNHQGMPSFSKSSFNPNTVSSLDIEMWYP
jgi:uncharacterized protein (DUF2141 family)